jgi:hypothetical protein
MAFQFGSSNDCQSANSPERGISARTLNRNSLGCPQKERPVRVAPSIFQHTKPFGTAPYPIVERTQSAIVKNPNRGLAILTPCGLHRITDQHFARLSSAVFPPHAIWQMFSCNTSHHAPSFDSSSNLLQMDKPLPHTGSRNSIRCPRQQAVHG